MFSFHVIQNLNMFEDTILSFNLLTFLCIAFFFFFYIKIPGPGHVLDDGRRLQHNQKQKVQEANQSYLWSRK